MFNSSVLPSSYCAISSNQDQYVYFMQAGCKADTIDVFLKGEMYLDKLVVAFIVVILDIVIGFFFYFSF